MFNKLIFFGLISAGCSLSLKQTMPQSIFSDKTTPGYALRKIKNDLVVTDMYEGRRSNKFTDKITSKDKWHLGSCTKSMTSYLIAILLDEKKLKLDTQVDQVLKVPMNSDVKKLTILNLLTHRSGLTEVNELENNSVWADSFKSNSTKVSRDNLVHAILKDKIKFSKDEKFEYSNSNYLILGAIIEKIESRPWEIVLKEKIFDKLGMSSCGFGPSATRDTSPPDQPWGHKYEDNQLVTVPPLTIETDYSDNPAALGPAGTVHCDFDSWSLFLKEMLAASNGQSQLLSSDTAKLFFTHYKDHVAIGGWGVSEKPWADGIIYSMVGSNTLNYAMFIIAPKKNIILMGATNSGAEESLKELSNQMKIMAQE